MDEKRMAELKEKMRRGEFVAGWQIAAAAGLKSYKQLDQETKATQTKETK